MAPYSSGRPRVARSRDSTDEEPQIRKRRSAGQDLSLQEEHGWPRNACSSATTTQRTRTAKDLLLAWIYTDLDLNFYDMSVESGDSSDPPPSSATYLRGLALQSLPLSGGKYTHKSRWVDWEIKKAAELKKKIVAVQLEKNTTTPRALYGVGHLLALSFNFDVIKKALE